MSRMNGLAALSALLTFAAACSQGSNPATTTTPRLSPSAEAASVGAKDIANEPGQPIEKVLEGRVAGVTVHRTSDGGIAVRIRGMTSLHGNNEPLYVLDGMPIQPGPGGSLSGVNPHDIESIKVLKDAAETALYGARGANGVIIIKTKKAVPPGQ